MRARNTKLIYKRSLFARVSVFEMILAQGDFVRGGFCQGPKIFTHTSIDLPPCPVEMPWLAALCPAAVAAAAAVATVLCR